MRPYGEYRHGVMVIGEGPGKTEDQRGKPWQGQAGKRLAQELKSLGVDLFGDCLSLNAVNCRPTTAAGKNRTPTAHEIACCRRKIVDPAIRKHKPHRPRLILLLGGPAVESVIGPRWHESVGAISKWRGWTIPDQEIGAWLCPTFHPSYVEREDKRPEIETVWRQDLERALAKIDEPLPDNKALVDLSLIRILKREGDIADVLRKITRGDEGGLIAIDYETTGIKPHAEGHRIVCASVASADNAYAFMWPESDRALRAWRRLLLSKRIGKAAHNMKFEHAWSLIHAGVEAQNWVWDSMLAAHVLDNRKGSNGLKFQAFVHFGVSGYDNEISHFLKGKDSKDANSMNRIDEFIQAFGKDAVLQYCGMDSMICFHLARQQMGKLKAR